MMTKRIALGIVDFKYLLMALPEPAPCNTNARKERISMAMKRTGQWIFSEEIPSDVKVEVGESSFSLHKFPLVSKCGYIRRLVAESKDSDLSRIELPTIPGGAEAFEQVAKFCYRTKLEIGPANVSMLRCAAEFLEMTENYVPSNLISRAEAYIQEVVLNNFSSAVTALHSCQNLLPAAEDLNIVARCVTAVAYLVPANNNKKDDNNSRPLLSPAAAMPDRWIEELTILRIDFYERVMLAMKAGGLGYESQGFSLTVYARKSLRGLLSRQKNYSQPDDVASAGAISDAQDRRVVLETIVDLLPVEKNATTVTFLCDLLKAANYLCAATACRADLERRIALQLDQATVDDLLVISTSYAGGDAVSDLEAVHRIVAACFSADQENRTCAGEHPEDRHRNINFSAVAKLLDSYFGEIAADVNLSIKKFVGLAELVPKHARDVDDGLYRAVDIFLKAHPSLNELEREKVCSVMDSHKLSFESRTHAAQNKRLPVQVVVQVLYYDQLRLRSGLNTSSRANKPENLPEQPAQKTDSAAGQTPAVPDKDLSAISQENRDLKMEIERMKMYVTEMEKKHKKSTFFSSVAKKLGKLNPFVSRTNVAKDADDEQHANPVNSAPRRRRYSIS